MRLLSFDIGIKNLSYCDLTYESPTYFTVHAWETLDVTKGVAMDMHCTAEALIKLVKQTFLSSSSLYDHILIENQPVMKNPTMKSIQMVLYTSFKFHQSLHPEQTHYNVHFVSPLNKNKCLKLIDKQSVDSILNTVNEGLKASSSKNKEYMMRKRLSVEIAKFLISNRQTNAIDTAEQTLQRHKKQDDLADNLNQAIYFGNAL